MSAIERAFDAVIGPLALPVDDALPFVEGGAACRAYLEALREGAQHLPVVVNDQTVERIRFLGDGEAEVSLGIWLGGSPQPMIRPAFAVLEGGTWKVSRSSVQEFAQLSQQFRRPPGF
jgi:hypothetical protein